MLWGWGEVEVLAPKEERRAAVQSVAGILSQEGRHVMHGAEKSLQDSKIRAAKNQHAESTPRAEAKVGILLGI